MKILSSKLLFIGQVKLCKLVRFLTSHRSSYYFCPLLILRATSLKWLFEYQKYYFSFEPKWLLYSYHESFKAQHLQFCRLVWCFHNYCLLLLQALLNTVLWVSAFKVLQLSVKFTDHTTFTYASGVQYSRPVVVHYSVTGGKFSES